MRLRDSVPVLCVPALLLGACEPETSDACASVEELYRVVATVGLREADDSKSAANAELQGAVLVSVFESSSVVACSGDLVSVSQPGAAVVAHAPVHLSAAGFTLDVPSTLYPNAAEPPRLGMDVLLDENGNGQCDDGEPHGFAAVEREAESNVHVELVRTPCTYRL
jgi:hypothetical protein